MKIVNPLSPPPKEAIFKNSKPILPVKPPKEERE
jgi:hypothetical protein